MWIGNIYARNTSRPTPAPTCRELRNLMRRVPQVLTYIQYASHLGALWTRTRVCKGGTSFAAFREALIAND